jgi:hypothetical protein
VDFVRQAQAADLVVLATTRQTGGGGREVVLRFVGQGRFTGRDHALRAVSAVNDTENTRREIVLRTVVVGLLNYVAEDGLPPGVNVSVTVGPPGAADDARADDPWDAWVFRLRASGSYEADATSRERHGQVNVDADRVTHDWKLSFGARTSRSVEDFDLDEDEPLKVTRLDRRVDWFLARSVSDHWSVGLDGRVSSSTYDNTRLWIGASPAVEYSVFPYDDYATRQFRLQYDVGLARVRYYETTIFGRTREGLWRQEGEATLDQRQPWGSLRIGASFSQYLHDRAKYRLESSGQVSLRLAPGLSLSASGALSRIRDQLSLPQREATDEEVLLRIRQLQSSYEVRFGVGVAYSFGSIFNNIINPRFD